jgi:hypothetical protein
VKQCFGTQDDFFVFSVCCLSLRSYERESDRWSYHRPSWQGYQFVLYLGITPLPHRHTYNHRVNFKVSGGKNTFFCPSENPVWCSRSSCLAEMQQQFPSILTFVVARQRTRRRPNKGQTGFARALTVGPVTSNLQLTNQIVKYGSLVCVLFLSLLRAVVVQLTFFLNVL